MSEQKTERSAQIASWRSSGLSIAAWCPENSRDTIVFSTGENAYSHRLINAYVEAARAKEDFSDVKRIGIDKTSTKKGHNYASFIFDLDRRKLLFGTEGKDNVETVKDFVVDLKKHGGDPEQITDAAIDMSKAFIKGVKEQLPNAVVTFDKFHLIRLINEALGKIRAEEARLFPDALKKSRYLFLKSPEDLTTEEEARMDTMVANQCYKSVEAHAHKLNLQNVYFADSRQVRLKLY